MATQESLDLVQKIYIAYYGRPADPLGQSYWADAIDAANGDAAAVINAFGTSTEATNIYGNLGAAAAVNNLYKQLFGRDADVAGLKYYVEGLNAGTFTLAGIALTIANGATGTDVTTLNAKIAAANAFTAAVDTTAEIIGYAGAAAATQARTQLATVVDAASQTTYVTNVDTNVANVVSTGSNSHGDSFTLTQGLDTIPGTNGNDTINAYAFNSVTGADVTTLNSVDTIDGGAGNDTLNIEVKTVNGNTYNGSLQGTVKNVETINIDNTGATAAATTLNNANNAVDASKFVGATAINQISKAANVEKLADGTTAGFKGVAATAQANLTVTAADAAATAKVALDAVIGDAATGNGTVENQAVLTVEGKALNSVTVSGTVAQADTAAGKAAASLNLTVNAGTAVTSVAVNTAVKTSLTVGNVANNTASVNTVNASASTGGITFNVTNNAVANATGIASLTTGSGNDVVGLDTLWSATTTAASVTTGAGDDKIYVDLSNNSGNGYTAATVASTVTVDAGDGNDTVTLNRAADTKVTYTVNAGAGDDKVVLSSGLSSVATTDVIDGGAGSNTIVMAGLTPVAQDYIALNDTLKNFQSIEFTSAATVDASKMTGYKSFTFDADNAGNSTITKVAADQSIVAFDTLTATAAGYTAATANAAVIYGGTLNITEKADESAVTASADTVNLTVAAVATTSHGSAANVGSALNGDVKTAVVTLTNAVDADAAGTTLHDNIASISIDANDTKADNNFTTLGGLTSLTLKGNGSAQVTNEATGKLATVDASQLGGTYTVTADNHTKGAATAGLSYTTSNEATVETITLGSGKDSLTFGASLGSLGSSQAHTDTVTGLNLVAGSTAGTLDFAKSDSITVLNVAAANGALVDFAKYDLTTAQQAKTLGQVLTDIVLGEANNTAAHVTFQYGGNTYVFADQAVGNGAAVGQVDGSDVLIKLTGTVDTTLLALALNGQA
ncbi:DUF4214 domain-containing protein [Zoogloea sp.]|uniref:DUF4214 domain-containing protein n=1 Tax=Zoogloea sp. TaxID=49181 RepID=UPI0035AFD2BA